MKIDVTFDQDVMAEGLAEIIDQIVDPDGTIDRLRAGDLHLMGNHEEARWVLESIVELAGKATEVQVI